MFIAASLSYSDNTDIF